MGKEVAENLKSRHSQIHTYMFVLRIITKEGVQSNTAMGDSYELIDRFGNSEQFREMFLSVFDTKHVADLDPESSNLTKKCHGFVVYDDCSVSVPLFPNNKYYVMTESGQTFSNISYNNK